MNINDKINQARQKGASDEDIMKSIINSNPNKATSFAKAFQQGANPSQILDEISKQVSDSQQSPKQKKDDRGFFRKAGDFFTSSTQKFGETIGAAASVIDPKTRKTRQESLSSTNELIEDYIQMARDEEDIEKKKKLLAAAESLAQTAGDYDIFNNEEYQKTAKQILGEGAGTALEVLSFGTYGKGVKGVQALTKAGSKATPTATKFITEAAKQTVKQTAIKGATTGGVVGALEGGARAAQEDESVFKGTFTGAAIGAIVGGATGFLAGKIASKTSKKTLAQKTAGKLDKKQRELAYRTGQMKEASMFRGEKFMPNKKQKALADLAQEINLKGKSISQDITKVNTNIADEATNLKSLLQGTDIKYSKTSLNKQLNKMKADKIVDLIEPEERVYEKMIAKFNKMASAEKNKNIDGLLDIRQNFDKWAKSNSPNIFANKRGGAYRALSSVRDTINDYINKQVGGDLVSNSLSRQSKLYTILDNLSEVGAGGYTKLKSAAIIKPLKKFGKVAGYVGGGYLLGKKGLNVINE